DGGGLFRGVTARRRPQQQPFHFRRRRRPHRAHQQSCFAEIEYIERPGFGQTFALTPFQRKHGLPFGRQSHRRRFHGSTIMLPKATSPFDPPESCSPATLLLPSSLVADLTFDFRHLETTNSRATVQMRGSSSNCQNGRQSNRHARIMKATRTDLKRKRCPMAVIKSTVARRTVMRTYWSPVSPDFVPWSAISAACFVKPRNCSCLAL